MTTDVNPVAELGLARQHVAELETQAREQVEAEEREARREALARTTREAKAAAQEYQEVKSELVSHLTALASLGDRLVSLRQVLRRTSWQAGKLDGETGVIPPPMFAQDRKARHVLDQARRALTAVGGI